MKVMGALYIIAVCIILMFSACSNNKNEECVKGIPVVIAEKFSTLKELKDRSPEIAEVSVTDTGHSIEYGETTFTIYKVNVTSKIKGTLKNGEEIKILEPGANIDNSITNNGDKYIVFMEKYVGPIVKDAYVIIGLYQGKFKIENDNIIQQVPEEHKLKDYEPVNREKFIKLFSES